MPSDADARAMWKVKLQHKWLILMWLWLWQVFVTPCAAAAEDVHFREFINDVEHLVMSTEDEALRATITIYQHLANGAMTPELKRAMQPLMANYVEMVEHVLANTTASNTSYSDKRKLLRHFRINNWKLEQLRQRLAPDSKKFQFEVISPEFYYNGRNTTQFDSIYLRFMQEFQRASQRLWDNLSEDVVERQEEMLELLDEISNEKNLTEKDKLYDEFIEMFLFKSPKDLVETRELE
ncbi:uncharacterized protein LOC105261848 [Musca domestica]|uniref:Uncharacterized protein LOC105261848 n=1 Tax=Musca domestica TaxID=7370 RepID=A0A1I8NJV8_MUSDO|nr:uncharacterized protein LOC105261848 [Musca domestica]